MTNISDPIQFPTTSDDWVVTVFIGGILTFLAFLLISLFIVYGYLLELIRTNYESITPPSSFENWGALLIDINLFTIICFGKEEWRRAVNGS